MSADEKKAKIVSWFYEKKDFFQLKEVEKQASKATGINPMQIKDVVMAAIADGLVESDKIGTSTYFWAFPCKAVISREKRIKELKEKIPELDQKIEQVRIGITEARVGREGTAERARLEAALKREEADSALCKTEQERLRRSDPEGLAQLQRATQKAVQSVNTITDDIETARSYCARLFGMSVAQINERCDLPDEIEYIK